MPSATELSALESFAVQILASAKTVTEYCSSTGHPQPSFGGDHELDLDVLPKAAPEHVLLARQDMIDAAKKVQQVATEPSQYVPQLGVEPQHIACLQWLCRFNIPSLVPRLGNMSYDDLATKANVPLDQLKSIVRMAMCGNFFQEPEPNMIAHNRVSAHFAKNPSLADWTLFMAEATTPMALKMYEATAKWGKTNDKTQTAFNLALDTHKPFFKYLSESEELTRRFAAYMKNVTASGGTSVDHLVNGFDWNKLGEAKVVDVSFLSLCCRLVNADRDQVGGSSGHASIALARKYEKLSFVVQDLPKVIETSQMGLSDLEANVASRIRFEEYDFFKAQPITDADVYVLRMILHDWPDKEAISILKNVVGAMKPGAKLIIMDTALPEPGSVGWCQEAQLRVRDMTMMETFNSHEREIEEWKALLVAADQRLQLTNSIQPFGSNMTVMEVNLS